MALNRSPEVKAVIVQITLLAILFIGCGAVSDFFVVGHLNNIPMTFE